MTFSSRDNQRAWSQRLDCFLAYEPRNYQEQIILSLAQSLAAVTYRILPQSNEDVLFWLPDDEFHGRLAMKEKADRYYVAVEDGHLLIQLDGHTKIMRFDLGDPMFEENVRQFWVKEHGPV